MTQSPRIMQLTRIAALLFACVAAQAAEPASAAAKTHPITLPEAIEFALKNNLDVQIQSLDPRIARFSLSAAYAPYDPALNFRTRQSYSQDEGQFNQLLGVNELSGERWTETFDASIGGLAPTGLEYSIGSTVNRNSGTFFDRNTLALGNRPFQYGSFAGITLSQPLLRDFWIDATRANITIAKTQVKISESAFRFRVMQVVNAVEQAYYNLIFARENVKVQEKALELAERLALENRKRVEVGALAPLDEKQAESQVASSKADLLDAKRNLAVQENIIKNLITSDYAAWNQVTLLPGENLVAIPATFDLQESWQRGFAMRPDLQQQKLDLEQRDVRVKYSRNQLFPRLDIEGSYGLNGVDENFGPVLEDIRERNNPAHSIGAVLSFPIGNIGARNNHKINKAQKERSILLLKQLEQNIMVEIDNAVKLAQTSFERVEATRQAKLFAEAALDATQKKLENGKATSFEVLQFQRDLTAARFQEIRALAEYNNSLAELAFREGTTLERHRLSLEIK